MNGAPKNQGARRKGGDGTSSVGSQAIFSQMSSMYLHLSAGFADPPDDSEEAPLPKSLVPHLTSVGRLLKTFTNKLQLAMTLPELLVTMPDLVKGYLPAELAPLMNRTVDRWSKRPIPASDMSPSFFFSATNNRASVANYYNQYKTMEHRTGSHRPDELLCLIVFTLLDNPHFVPKLQAFKRQQPMESQKMTKAVSLFLQNALKNMTVSPQQEMMTDVRLEKMYHFNQWAKEEIMIIERNVHLQNEIHKHNEVMRHQVVEAIRQELVDLQDICHKRIEHNRQDNEEQMVWEIKVSEHRQNMLNSTIRELEKELADLKEHNQNLEDDARIRRHKTEQQLRTILKKFDEDVFARQKLYTRVDLEHQEELQQMRQLQEKFNEQDIEYTALYEEKMAYEESVRRAALKEIYKRIAARIIQRFYRYYVMMCNQHGVQRFDIKRKKKKGKKK